MGGSDGWGGTGLTSLVVLASCTNEPAGVVAAIFPSVGVTFWFVGRPVSGYV